MIDKNQTSNLNERIIRIVKNQHPETVEQLVELVQQEHPVPQQEILKRILNLQNQGKLAFKKNVTVTPLTLKNYLSSSNSYWYWITITLALATTATVFTIPENTYPIIYIRHVLGSIFILFLPGYSLIKTLFPTRELDNIERTALSIGMSLALVPMIGLLLNYTPWGIRTNPITLSLLTLTLTLATAALIREHKTQSNQANHTKNEN